MFQQFTDTIAELSLTADKDTTTWTLNSSQVFSVKTCYNAINDGGLRAPHQNNVWYSVVPLKVNVFSWLALKDKILTHANLIKRGWQGPPRCRICGNQEEMVLHIFFHCSFAQVKWNFLLRDAVSLLPGISYSNFFFATSFIIPN